MGDAMAQMRRLAILKALDAAGNGSMSDIYLQAALERLGQAVPLHVLGRDLNWLEDIDLLSTSDMAAGMRLVVLRREGAEVAQGKAYIDGIAKAQRPG